MRRVVKTRWFGLALLFLLTLPLSVTHLAAQGSRDDVVIELPSGSTIEMLRDTMFARWAAWSSHVQAGDLGGAAALEVELLDLIQKNQVPGVDILGGATAREGFLYLDAGRTEEARACFQLAEKISPGLPQAHFGLGDLALQADKDPIGWIRNSLAGVRQELRGIWGGFFLKANLILVLMAGLVLFTVVFAFVQLLKYHQLYRHSVSEKLSKKFTFDLGRMIGLGILFLPALLWFGPSVLALWWIALLFPYADGREKVVAWAGAVIVAVLPLGLHQVQSRTAYLDDPVLIAASKLAGGEVDARTVRDLDRIVGVNPENLELRFLYSLGLLRSGQPDAAKQQLQELTSKSQGFERAWNNLGNIFFREGDYRQAIQAYMKATEVGGCYALAHYNMALAHQNLLDSPKYHEEIQRSHDCDPTLRDTLPSAETVVDAELSNEELLEIVRSAQDAPTQQASFAKLLLNPLSILAVVLLIFLGTRSAKKRGGLSRACIKCGRPFCNACQPGASTSSYCTQCMHLYIKKDGVAPSVRVQKSKEVERHARRARWYARVLDLLIPGAGHIYEDRTALGLFLLAVWCVALAALVVCGQFVEFPQQVVEMRSSFLLIANLALLGLIWATANLMAVVARR